MLHFHQEFQMTWKYFFLCLNIYLFIFDIFGYYLAYNCVWESVCEK